MKRISILIAIAGAAVLAVSAFFYLSRPGAGDPAPDFTLRSLESEEVSLKDYRGRPVIVHFWATFCETCIKEFPSLVQLQKDYGDSGLVVLAVSEDDIEMFARAFVKGRELHGLKILLDKDGSAAKGYSSFGVPEDIYIDKNGIIVHRSEGPVEWDSPVEKRRIEKLFVE